MKSRYQNASTLFLLILAISPAVANAVDPNQNFFSKGFVTNGLTDNKQNSTSTPSNNTWTVDIPKAPAINKLRTPEMSPPLSPAAETPPASAVEQIKEIQSLDSRQTQDSFEHFRQVIERVKKQEPGLPSTPGTEMLRQGSTPTQPSTKTPTSPPSQSLSPVKETSIRNSGPQPPTTATLSLVISSSPKEHLLKNFSKLLDLQSKQGVTIDKVYIVGISDIKALFDPELWKPFEKFKFEGVEFRPVLSVPKDIPVTKSPAWVVRYNNKNYIFEGGFEPSRLFTSRGEFLEPRPL